MDPQGQDGKDGVGLTCRRVAVALPQNLCRMQTDGAVLDELKEAHMAETKIEWCDFTFNPWIGCEGRGAGVRQATGGATSRESSAAACSSPRIIKTSEAVE